MYYDGGSGDMLLAVYSNYNDLSKYLLLASKETPVIYEDG